VGSLCPLYRLANIYLLLRLYYAEYFFVFYQFLSFGATFCNVKTKKMKTEKMAAGDTFTKDVRGQGSDHVVVIVAI
jgi:hypothetical protein